MVLWDSDIFQKKKIWIFISNRVHFWSNNEDPCDGLFGMNTSVLFASRNNSNFDSNYLESTIIRICLIFFVGHPVYIDDYCLRVKVQ